MTLRRVLKDLTLMKETHSDSEICRIKGGKRLFIRQTVSPNGCPLSGPYIKPNRASEPDLTIRE